ncbi:MAG TPA: SGNH/GDSL hydrolase family protein [Cyclobacteriaceae bacterium]|nr:SGNH/GDSL hydrolase family protein [Cyclobacteriaceae bacterium]
MITSAPSLEGQKRYLALGDSYTIGESVEENERWPNQLAALLSARGVSIGKPTIIATTGWRTDNLANAVKIAGLRNDYDLVSLLIGVNNQYQGKPFDLYTADFERLLVQSIWLARGQKKNVFVVSIPDYGYTPFGNKNMEKISREIDQYNAAAKSSCTENQIRFVDITNISRDALNDPGLVAADGLHPSGKMYTLWAKQILKEINWV